MKFRTEIDIAPLGVKIGYGNRILALGSCFAEHIAGRLAEARFRIVTNPTGILFNPSPSPPRCAAMRTRRPYSIPSWTSTANCGSTTGSTALFRPRRPTRRWLR